MVRAAMGSKYKYGKLQRAANPANDVKIRNSYTWQDLKDHVRPAASHVGHVAVYANGRATITVRKIDEAKRCFGKTLRSIGRIAV